MVLVAYAVQKECSVEVFYIEKVEHDMEVVLALLVVNATDFLTRIDRKMKMPYLIVLLIKIINSSGLLHRFPTPDATNHKF